MKFEIYRYNTVTSTNDVAIELIKEKKKKIGSVYAENQTKGRGNKGKKWISSKGNFFGTIFFPLKNNYPPFNEFSIINSVIASEVVRHFCNKNKISVKWPNDVFVNGKKICGILQEVINMDGENFLIIGIGVNITTSPFIKNVYQTTNIYSETKKRPTIREMNDQIISSYEKFFANLSSYKYMDFIKKAESIATK